MTLQELIDRALSIASAGLDPSVAQSLTSDIVAEDLLLTVFARVGAEAARDERTRHLLRRTKTLEVVNGAVQLPGDTLSTYIADSVLTDPDDTTKRYSYLRPSAFVREDLDTRLGHYSMVGEFTMRVVEPGDVYTPNAGPTITLELSIPCVPEVPATANTNIAVSDEVADMLVEGLARALRPVIETRARR